jgi:hypothetical protein
MFIERKKSLKQYSGYGADNEVQNLKKYECAIMLNIIKFMKY